jgi:hypothetical protein
MLSRIYWLDTWFGLVTGFIRLLHDLWLQVMISVSVINTSHSLVKHARSFYDFTGRCYVTASTVGTPPRLRHGVNLTSGSDGSVCLQTVPWLRVKVMLRTTVSANLSWCQAPIWGPRIDFITVKWVQVCWCGSPSPTRGRVCRLQLLLIPFLGRVPRDSWPYFILLSQIPDSPNLVDQVPVFISSRNRVN